MPLLPRFDPPGFMSDFDGVRGLREQWSAFMARCFDETIALEKKRYRAPHAWNPQYYDATVTDPGPVLEQEIPWNAFPKELLRAHGRERALREADRLRPLSQYSGDFDGKGAKTTPYRPLTEYCEWHVERDPNTNAIRKVTFSSEPPEYWQALFGGEVPTPSATFRFKARNPNKVLELYRELVNPGVQADDLVAHRDIVLQTGSGGTVIRKGDYNIYNKWNTTLGIAHLSAPPNSLAAEVQLGGDASVLYANAKGELVVEPDPLICCAGYGGSDRNSDPTIGATVNALARLGAMITLRNPVGLYMDHIDLTGWSLPNGIAARDCVRVARGDAKQRMIERLVVEVPPETGYTISDVTIAGEPIRYGGQIAECITVKLVGLGALAGVHNVPVACDNRCCVDPAYLRTLDRAVGKNDPTPVGYVDAFDGEGVQRLVPAVVVPVAQVATGAPQPVAHHERQPSMRGAR
jgi:hypothetical protein